MTAIAAYPLAVHVYNAPRQDEIDTVEADDVNSLRVELVAIEQALGLFTGTSGTPIGTILQGFFGTGISTFKDAIHDVDVRAFHLAGNETVTGNKTFSGTVTFSGSDVLLAGLVAGDPNSLHTRLTSSGLQAYSDSTTTSTLTLQPSGGAVSVAGALGVAGTSTFSGEADFNGAFKVNTSRPQLKHNSTSGGVDVLGTDGTEFFLRATSGQLQVVNAAYTAVLASLSDGAGNASFGQNVDAHGTPARVRLYDGSGGAWSMENLHSDVVFMELTSGTKRAQMSLSDGYFKVFGAPSGVELVDTGFGNDDWVIRPYAGALQLIHNGTIVIPDLSDVVTNTGGRRRLSVGSFTVTGNGTAAATGTLSVYADGPFASTCYGVVVTANAYTGNTAVIVQPTFINGTGFGWRAELRNGGVMTSSNPFPAYYVAIGDR